MYKPLRQWLWSILVMSLALNPLGGSGLMLHAPAALGNTTTPLITPTDKPSELSTADEHCGSDSVNRAACCCPMLASACDASAIHALFSTSEADRIQAWLAAGCAHWHSQPPDVDPRPPRLLV